MLIVLLFALSLFVSSFLIAKGEEPNWRGLAALYIPEYFYTSDTTSSNYEVYTLQTNEIIRIFKLHTYIDFWSTDSKYEEINEP